MRRTFITIASIAVLCGMLAISLYLETATTPGELMARAHGCLLCHPHWDATPWIVPQEQQTPIREQISKTIQQAHPWVSDTSAQQIAEYVLPSQQQLLAASRSSNDAANLYQAKCAACHGADGQGDDLRYPPLRGSEWLTDSPSRLPEILRDGLQGPIMVKGRQWNAIMLPPGIAPGEETESLIRYIRQTFATGHTL